MFRVTRWSEATEDVAAFRRLALDGPLSIAAECRAMVRFALSCATVRTDDQGSCRVVKRQGDRSRDDVVQAGILAAGLMGRARPARPVRMHVA